MELMLYTVVAVALVLQRLEGDELRLDVLARPQIGEGARQVLDGGDEDAALLERLLRRRLHAVELEQVAGLVDVVDDVVDRARQLVDVLAVERRDVLRVQELDQLVRQPIALVLPLLHILLRNIGVRELAEPLLDEARRLERVRPCPGEEVVELARARNQSQAHRCLLGRQFGGRRAKVYFATGSSL